MCEQVLQFWNLLNSGFLKILVNGCAWSRDCPFRTDVERYCSCKWRATDSANSVTNGGKHLKCYNPVAIDVLEMWQKIFLSNVMPVVTQGYVSSHSVSWMLICKRWHCPSENAPLNKTLSHLNLTSRKAKPIYHNFYLLFGKIVSNNSIDPFVHGLREYSPIIHAVSKKFEICFSDQFTR